MQHEIRTAVVDSSLKPKSRLTTANLEDGRARRRLYLLVRVVVVDPSEADRVPEYLLLLYYVEVVLGEDYRYGLLSPISGSLGAAVYIC